MSFHIASNLPRKREKKTILELIEKTRLIVFDGPDLMTTPAPSSLATQPLFYIYDEDERSQVLSLAPLAQGLSQLELLLTIPIELTHSYSYAQLLPHSLALRLNILKRSLEILKDRPNLVRLLVPEDNDESDDWMPPIYPTLSNQLVQSFKTSIFKHKNNSQDVVSGSPNSAQMVPPNALSAALAALFRPPIRRLDSFPVEKVLSTGKSNQPIGRTVSASHDSTQISELIGMIQSDSEQLMRDTDVAKKLHNLSLSRILHILEDELAVKKKLLYALATPFVDHPQNTALLLAETNQMPKSPSMQPLLLALNTLTLGVPLAPPGSTNPTRVFHAQSKKNAPQLVFTVSMDMPWEVKAANDLACIMFGVLKAQFKSLTLMDLIAPQFRDFVFQRLNRCLYAESFSKRQLNLEVIEAVRKDIIFAGEIVAISKPGLRNFTYTSLWAKRKGSLIICMFDQIHCDAFDVVVQVPSASVSDVKQITGDFVLFSNQWDSLALILSSLTDDIKKSTDVEAALSIVSHRRYYTLTTVDEDGAHPNVPCAVIATAMELDHDESMKLKIHALPYIAGMFVINSKFHVLSCNNAIARNLLGILAPDVYDKLLDLLIPKFSQILNYGVEASGISIVPGLVLPEHFFRKYDAVLRLKELGSLSLELQEELFFSSTGIEAIHRDGGVLYVDVQLRVLSVDTFVIWVTYSRPVSKIKGTGPENVSVNHETIEHESQLLIPVPLDEHPSLHTVLHRRTVTTSELVSPSLPQSEVMGDKDDIAYDPPKLQRNKLVRKAKAGTFAFPVKFLTDKTRNELHFKLRNVLMDEGVIALTDETSEKLQVSTITTHLPFHIYSETEMLKLENDQLKKVMAELRLWPREIGTSRRTKKFNEFVVEKEMGEGAYGKVVLAHHKEDNNYRVIIKCIDKERILVDTWVRDRQLGTIPSEIQIMNTLNAEPHPNIMKIVDFFEDSKYYYLETPIFGNPPAIDLFDYIEVKSDMTEDECRFIFRQICSLIYHLHKHGIVHRDIKDENIIVDENRIIKLIDFGLAGYSKQGPFDVFVGTIDYALPEVLRGERYEGKPQDIWALGILLYTMLYKENPFYNVDEIMEGDLRIPYVISQGSLSLVKRILQRDIDQRPTITDIVEDDWLRL